MPGMYKYNGEKAKFNPHKCRKCKYHSEHTGLGYHIRLTKTKAICVSCNYSGITNHTCLQPSGKCDTIDTRGNEYDNCKLFDEGKMISGGYEDGEDEDTLV